MFVMKRKKELEGITLRENVSFNLANSIMSGIYGGKPITQSEHIKEFTVRYEGGLFIEGKGNNTFVYGDIPKKVLNKLNDYSVVLERLN